MTTTKLPNPYRHLSPEEAEAELMRVHALDPRYFAGPWRHSDLDAELELGIRNKEEEICLLEEIIAGSFETVMARA
jgi:hypothetical protein